MTIPGGDSGEKAQDEPKQPPPTVEARPHGVEVPPSGVVPPPAAEGQMPAQLEPNTFRDLSDSRPSGPVPPSIPPTFGYPPPRYPPPGYPPPGPPPGYRPPGHQDAPGYGGPPYPPVYGQPHPGGYPPPGYPGGDVEQPETNTLAIVALVASLVGLLCLVGSIVGIVFGAVAANQIKQTREPGYGLAIAAIVVGVATLVVYLIFAITIRMH
jgi:uncharacterized protein DUF4190